MSIEITSNGSKWLGEAPDLPARLLEVLATNPLDPTFERYGNFVLDAPAGEVRVWGNFYELSHVFDMQGPTDEMQPLVDAIRANQQSEAYQKARDDQHIVITAKRWFQKSAGNTYHSVSVTVAGDQIGYVPFAYGYGEQYLQTALGILQVNGYRQKTGEHLTSGMDKDFYDFVNDMRDHRERYTVIVTDVARKKDL